MGGNLYPLYDLFNLFPPNLNWVMNDSFGFSLLPYRIELVLFWFAVLIGAALWKLLRRRRMVRRTGLGICVVVCAVCMGLYVQPVSKHLMNHHPRDGLFADFDYYEKNGGKAEAAAFEITQYALDLRVGNRLYAKAALTVDRPALPAYTFTLYHGYQVKSAADQNGNPLRYRQSGDYLEIAANDDRDLRTIHLVYDGYSPRFYSNTQGIFLPGYFPYYPYSGYRYLYDLEEQGFRTNVLDAPVDFTVHLQTHQPVYTNLGNSEGGGKSTFSGKTDGLTLLSGFLDTVEIEGIEVVYPYLNNGYAGNSEKVVADLLAVKEASQTVNKIMVLPDLNTHQMEWAVVFGDYITTANFFGLAQDYAAAKVNYEKKELYLVIDEYRHDRQAFDTTVAFLAGLSDGAGDANSYVLVDKAIRAIGEEAFLKKAETYMHDSTDTRTITQFFDDLYE